IHSLLSAIRELYLEAKVRFITGRPRKTEKRLQMKKSTTKKKVNWDKSPQKSGMRVCHAFALCNRTNHLI
ncbi:MAG: hypothetical protein J6R80_04590, partial [Kiritimatiellae bacterium]|nr:hypothetical protein [Kiritimatiellia bacterium]